MTEPIFEERRSNTGISVKLDHLADSVGEMKGALKDLAIAVNRLAVVETTQTHLSQAQERGFVALEKVEERVAALEKTTADSKRTSGYVDKALWVAAAASVIFVAHKVGLI